MRRVLLVACVAVMLVAAGCTGGIGIGDGESDDDDAPPLGGGAVDGELEVHHIDLGQADSTLLITPEGETVLVDMGDWRQDGSDVIAYLEAEGVDRIDHLIATHAHADHLGGHAAIIEHFETEGDGVGAAYDSGVSHDSATYDRYLDAIEDNDVDLLLVEEGDELPIDDDLGALVVNPPEVGGDDLHYYGVSILFEFGEFRYLTTGDAETDAEARMIDEWGDALDADVYQAGHHGSSTSSTAPFVDVVDPAVTILSSAYDSQYGHPHDEVLEDHAERGIETYWTAVHGHVVVTTDGSEFTIDTTSEFSTDPAALLAEKPDGNDDAAEAINTRPALRFTG